MQVFKVELAPMMERARLIKYYRLCRWLGYGLGGIGLGVLYYSKQLSDPARGLATQQTSFALILASFSLLFVSYIFYVLIRLRRFR